MKSYFCVSVTFTSLMEGETAIKIKIDYLITDRSEGIIFSLWSQTTALLPHQKQV